MTRLRLPLLLAVVSTLASMAADMSLDQGTLKGDTLDAYLREGIHHVQGHVEFRYPGTLDLNCDDLKIRLLPGGEKVDRLTASNNVVMTMVQRGSTPAGLPMNRASGKTVIHAAVAEYTSTNDTVTLTGSPTFGQPWVEGAEGSFRADVITFDRAQDKIGARGNFQMIIKPNALPKDALDAPRSTKPTP